MRIKGGAFFLTASVCSLGMAQTWSYVLPRVIHKGLQTKIHVKLASPGDAGDYQLQLRSLDGSLASASFGGLVDATRVPDVIVARIPASVSNDLALGEYHVWVVGCPTTCLAANTGLRVALHRSPVMSQLNTTLRKCWATLQHHRHAAPGS